MVKYTKQVENKKIVLTEKDYLQILDRFDVNKFISIAKDEGNFAPFVYKNSIPCSLCEKFYYAKIHSHCSYCPLKKFEKEEKAGSTIIFYAGCTALLKLLRKKFTKNYTTKILPLIQIEVDEIIYLNKMGKEFIQYIHKQFKTFKKVT